MFTPLGRLDVAQCTQHAGRFVAAAVQPQCLRVAHHRECGRVARHDVAHPVQLRIGHAGASRCDQEPVVLAQTVEQGRVGRRHERLLVQSDTREDHPHLTRRLLDFHVLDTDPYEHRGGHRPRADEAPARRRQRARSRCQAIQRADQQPKGQQEVRIVQRVLGQRMQSDRGHREQQAPANPVVARAKLAHQPSRRQREHGRRHWNPHPQRQVEHDAVRVQEHALPGVVFEGHRQVAQRHLVPAPADPGRSADRLEHRLPQSDAKPGVRPLRQRCRIGKPKLVIDGAPAHDDNREACAKGQHPGPAHPKVPPAPHPPQGSRANEQPAGARLRHHEAQAQPGAKSRRQRPRRPGAARKDRASPQRPAPTRWPGGWFARDWRPASRRAATDPSASRATPAAATARWPAHWTPIAATSKAIIKRSAHGSPCSRARLAPIATLSANAATYNAGSTASDRNRICPASRCMIGVSARHSSARADSGQCHGVFRSPTAPSPTKATPAAAAHCCWNAGHGGKCPGRIQPKTKTTRPSRIKAPRMEGKSQVCGKGKRAPESALLSIVG